MDMYKGRSIIPIGTCIMCDKTILRTTKTTLKERKDRKFCTNKCHALYKFIQKQIKDKDWWSEMEGTDSWMRFTGSYDVWKVPPIPCGLCTEKFVPKETEQEVCYRCIKLATTTEYVYKPRKMKINPIIGESLYAFIIDPDSTPEQLGRKGKGRLNRKKPLTPRVS